MLAWISLVSKMELSRPSLHNAAVNRNAVTVLEKVKAALMSNLEEPKAPHFSEQVLASKSEMRDRITC